MTRFWRNSANRKIREPLLQGGGTPRLIRCDACPCGCTCAQCVGGGILSARVGPLTGFLNATCPNHFAQLNGKTFIADSCTQDTRYYQGLHSIGVNDCRLFRYHTPGGYCTPEIGGWCQSGTIGHTLGMVVRLYSLGDAVEINLELIKLRHDQACNMFESGSISYVGEYDKPFNCNRGYILDHDGGALDFWTNRPLQLTITFSA